MNCVNKLLDKAREVCALASDHALADRVGVSRQQVSQWRKGHNPMSDDRVTQIARLAHEDPGPWLVAVRAEQSHGDAARAWSTLARRLATAATLAAVVALPSFDASTTVSRVAAHGMHYAKRFIVAVGLMLTRRRLSWSHGPAPVLA